jgi:HAD superfamily hydrolase (TIGR01509 family)
MDGVIVDSEPTHYSHLKAYLKTLGVKNPEDLTENLKGVNASDTWDLLIAKFNLTHEKQFLINDSRSSYLKYLQNLDQLPEIPGAVDLIKTLSKKGHRLALASSSAPKRIELFLGKLNIKSYFEVIVSGDDVSHSKPDPEIFILAAKLMKSKVSDCIVIEDANTGVRAAKAADMTCIAYAGSIHNDDDLHAADLIVKDFEALARSVAHGGLPL